MKSPVIASVNEAKALADEIRVFILDLLSRRPMSVHEISKELEKAGIRKNINTIRYHIQILKEAGLISLVATQEVKGGVLKYYATRKKVYPVERVPEEVEKILEPLVGHIYGDLKRLILELLARHRDEIVEVSKRLKPCPYCVTKHFAEYAVLEALRMAAGRALHDEDVRQKLEDMVLEEELAAE